MATSLFRRVTRYPANASVDPRENRLTEITAAVLERAPGLALALVGELLGGHPRFGQLASDLAQAAEPRVDVRTQCVTSSGRFADLEIRIRPALRATDATGMLIWVEVKHGSGLHGDQVAAYTQDIADEYRGERLERVVVVLAPRNWVPDRALPPGVPTLAWDNWGRVASDHAARESDPQSRWLLDQYIEYLQEEYLMEPEALTAVSAVALMEANAGEAAAASVCEYADAVVNEAWGQRTKCSKRARRKEPAFGLGYWAHHPPKQGRKSRARTWEPGWFEWGLSATFDMEYLEIDPRGSWVFTAGLTFPGKPAATEAMRDPAMTALGRRGVQYTYFGGYYRLVRFMYPDELLARSSVDEQGRLLGDWLVTTFEAFAKPSAAARKPAKRSS